MPTPRKFTHVFKGRRYTVKLTNKMPPDRHGACDAPTTPGKTILMRPNLDEELALKVAIDEALHACFWSLDNNEVHGAAIDIAKFLMKLGFRRVEDQQDD